MTRGALDYFCCDGFLDGFVCEKGYDDTWECTDRKDHLGNVIEEQGAISWGCGGVVGGGGG